jgi:hypothetical protein
MEKEDAVELRSLIRLDFWCNPIFIQLRGGTDAVAA